MKALLLIAVQNDYLPGGAMPTHAGDRIIAPINHLMAHFPLVLAARDWHPEESIHFESWPVHCVQYTYGAEYPASLDKSRIEQEFLIGDNPETDSGHTAFEAVAEPLEKFLRSRGVNALYVCGLSTEHGVRSTVLDALNRNIPTYVFVDAIAALDPAAAAPALDDMRNHGAILVRSGDILGVSVASDRHP